MSCPINFSENDVDQRDDSTGISSSEIDLIASNFCYMDKTVSEVGPPHLLVFASNGASVVKDICVDDGVRSFDKILTKYDKLQREKTSTLNLPRRNGNTPFMEEMIGGDNPQKLKSSTSGVGERIFSSPPRCVTDVDETTVRTGEKEQLSLFVIGTPVKYCYYGQEISEEVHLDGRELIARELVTYKNPREKIEPFCFVREYNANLPKVDSSRHSDNSDKNPDKGQNCDQVTEEQNLTFLASSSPMEAKESKQTEERVSSSNEHPEEDNRSSVSVAYMDNSMVTRNIKASDDAKLQLEIVPSNNDHPEEENKSLVTVECTGTGSNMKENIKGASDDVKLLDDATTADLGSKVISIVGNDSEDVNNENAVAINNAAGTEQPIVDGTTSVRSSLTRITHGDSGLPGPACLSGLIAASDYIPYSGSISLRSDSSTTSAHSFAFPILQSEWNSSPVKMAKADRRHLRRQRGWRTALICCKF